MKVIRPVDITAPGVLISSTLVEPAAGEVAWTASATYTKGQKFYRASTHRIYRCLLDHTGISTPPESDLEAVAPNTTARWEDFAPTNKWAMFDQEINTQSVATGSMSVELAPGICNALALFDLEGGQVDVSMTSSAGGPTVFSSTIDLDTSRVTDAYEYCFEPFSTRRNVVLLNLPPYMGCRLTGAISGSGTVKCGQLVVGTLCNVGGTLKGITSRTRDFSTRSENKETGVISLKPGKKRRTISARLEVLKGAENATVQLLDDLLGKPCVWLGDDNGLLDPLTTVGFASDLALEFSTATSRTYSLTIEGLT
ncbi:MAG: hypothetical protein C0423_03220 [Methylibium sp.]|nr:hypothetical protein [Methylibium sp.]